MLIRWLENIIAYTDYTHIVRQLNMFHYRQSTVQKTPKLVSAWKHSQTAIQDKSKNLYSLTNSKVAHLQRTIGNQKLAQVDNSPRVTRVVNNGLQRKCNSSQQITNGECPDCREKRLRLQRWLDKSIVKDNKKTASDTYVESRKNVIKSKLFTEIQRQTATSQVRVNLRALQASQNMLDYLSTQHILFDYWGGDCRDNNKNGRVDDEDPIESRASDGAHYGKTYPGFKTKEGQLCEGGEGNMVGTLNFETNVSIKYRVCADIVSQAYREAGVPVPRTRRVHDLVHWFQTNRRCRFYMASSLPDEYMPGDFICSYSPREQHGHAGMIVQAGKGRPMVVHLPGPSQHIARGVYDPTRTTDLTLETWPTNRAIYGIGRFIGR